MTSQAEAAPDVSATHRFLVVVTSLLSTLGMALSATIVNVAVPDIMGTFGVGQDQAQWLATAFFAAMTAGMLVCDWSLRSFGQRDTFIVVILIFIAGSAIGGTASTFGIVVTGRTIQGFAGGVMLTLTMIAMFAVFPPSRRAMVAGLYGFSFVLGPGLGPWFGGMAIDAFNWRFTFYVAVPVAFVSMLLAAFVLPGREQGAPRARLDWIGFCLVALFLGASLTGLSNGQLKGWNSNFVIAVLGSGLWFGAAFLAWEARHRDPIFDVRLFRHLRFALACFVSFLFGASLFGSLYLAPIFVQLVQNYTPTRAGLVLIPGGLVLGIVLPMAGRLADRFPPYWPIVVGFATFAVSMWWLGHADPDTAFWTFAWLIVLGRIGMGMIFPPLTAAGLAPIPPHRIANANGMLSFTRQMGGAFGINGLAIYLERQTAYYADLLAATQNEVNATTRALLDGTRALLAPAGLPDRAEGALATWHLGRIVASQASALAFRDTFYVFAIVSGMAAVIALFLWSPRGRSGR